jgi:hypothetical protein
MFFWNYKRAYILKDVLYEQISGSNITKLFIFYESQNYKYEYKSLGTNFDLIF